MLHRQLDYCGFDKSSLESDLEQESHRAGKNRWASGHGTEKRRRVLTASSFMLGSCRVIGSFTACLNNGSPGLYKTLKSHISRSRYRCFVCHFRSESLIVHRGGRQSTKTNSCSSSFAVRHFARSGRPVFRVILPTTMQRARLPTPMIFMLTSTEKMRLFL